jgi:hypothetical protein
MENRRSVKAFGECMEKDEEMGTGSDGADEAPRRSLATKPTTKYMRIVVFFILYVTSFRE